MSGGTTPDEQRQRERRDEFTRLWEERDASEGHRVLVRSLSLRNSLDVFRGNHAELKAFLEHVASPSVMVHMWNQEHSYRAEYALREAARLLHNYVASAFSLVDSTRRFVEKHYAGTPLMEEYEARVRRDFAEAPLHRFLQQLRNLTLHQRVPPMRASTRWRRRDDGGQDFENGFWLDLEELRGRGDWTGKAREYLDSLGEEAKLDDIIDAYEPVVAGFHQWLQERIRKEHADAIEETLDLERRIMEAKGRAYPEGGDGSPAGRPEPEAPDRALVLSSLAGLASREDRDALATPDDVVVALYESLSYPHGGVPNLDRLRSLFLPGAQIVEVDRDGEAYLEDVEGLIGRHHLALREGSVTSLSEHETACRSEPVGEVAHVLSFHETRYVEDGEEKHSKGMYDIHLVKAGERWAITGMHLCHGYVARQERSPGTRRVSKEEPSEAEPHDPERWAGSGEE